MTLLNDLVKPMIEWIHVNPAWSSFFIFTISFLESLAIIGSIVPGSVTMTGIGVMVGGGIVPFYTAFIWSIAGAVLGDNASYFLGYYYRDHIVDYWPFRRYPNIIDKGKQYFISHGGKSVFVGRFIGPLRSIVPLVAGMLNMSQGYFFIANFSSAILWAMMYLIPGILIGSATHIMSAEQATLLLMYCLIAVMGLWVMFYLLKIASFSLTKYTQNSLESAWKWLNAHPRLKRVVNIIAEKDKPLSATQLLIFLSAITSFTLFIIVSLKVKTSSHFDYLNLLFSYLLQSIRIHSIDDIFILISFSANKVVLLSFALLIITTCFYLGYKRKAYYLTSVCFFSSALIYVIKKIVSHPRPELIVTAKATFSYPSGHTVLATTIVGFLCFLFSYHSDKYSKRLVYSSAVIYCLLVGISRIYLGDHWFSDVLGGYLLGLTILFIHTLCYRKSESDVLFIRFIPFFTIYLLIICLFAIFNFSKIKQRTQFNRHHQVIQEASWWHMGATTPYDLWRRNHIGTVVHFLNLQVLATPDTLLYALKNNGWQEKKHSDLTTYLRYLIQPESQRSKLLFSPLYLNQPPAIHMTKTMSGHKYHIIVWNSEQYLSPTHNRLLIGALLEVTIRSKYKLMRHLKTITYKVVNKPSLLFNNHQPHSIKGVTANKHHLYLIKL